MKTLLLTIALLFITTTAFAETVNIDYYDGDKHGGNTGYHLHDKVRTTTATVHDPVNIDQEDRFGHGVYWVNTWKSFDVKGRSVKVETDLRKRLNNASANEGYSGYVGLRTEWP